MSFSLPLRVEQRKGKYKNGIHVLLDSFDQWICTTTTDERAANLHTLAAQANEMHFMLCESEGSI